MVSVPQLCQALLKTLLYFSRCSVFIACEYGLVSAHYIEHCLVTLVKIQVLHSGLLKVGLVYSYRKSCRLYGLLTRFSCDGFLIHVQV